MPISFKFNGSLDHERLQRSAGEILRRHKTLKLGFIERNGELFQEVNEEKEVLVEIYDLSNEKPRKRLLKLHDLIERVRIRPFDLERGEGFRTASIQIKNDEYVILLMIHHLIFDAWSQEILLRELLESYQTGRISSAAPDFEHHCEYVMNTQLSHLEKIDRHNLDLRLEELRG